MAITINSELKTAVANWLSRDDLTSRIPEFIALAEAKMNRDLRTLDQETKTAAFSINAEYVNVPSSFLEVRSFQVDASNRYSLQFMPNEQMSDKYPTGTGAPLYYCVAGSQFRFAPVPDATYTATLTYYVSLTALSAAGDTNWVLTKHPDAYLYGSLFEAAALIKDVELAQGYAALYSQAIASIQKANNRNRWGGPGLQVRPG
jgi:hypothetical protein